METLYCVVNWLQPEAAHQASMTLHVHACACVFMVKKTHNTYEFSKQTQFFC